MSSSRGWVLGPITHPLSYLECQLQGPSVPRREETVSLRSTQPEHPVSRIDNLLLHRNRFLREEGPFLKWLLHAMGPSYLCCPPQWHQENFG